MKGRAPRQKLAASFRCAFAGLAYGWRQRNLRLHLAAAAGAILLALALRVTGAELALLVLTVGLVLVAELLNTALEALVDLAVGEYHQLAKAAKDVAAAAVLVSALAALLVGAIIFLPRLAALSCGGPAGGAGR